jgi:hypothetical protein
MLRVVGRSGLHTWFYWLNAAQNYKNSARLVSGVAFRMYNKPRRPWFYVAWLRCFVFEISEGPKRTRAEVFSNPLIDQPADELLLIL